MQQPIPQRLVSDQALVIVGPQGSGKKLLAQQLAKKHAPYMEVDIEQVLDEYLFHGALKSTPRTLIIDGFAQSPTELRFIKTLVASRTWSFNMKRSKTAHTFKVPNLIFCATDDSPYLPTEQDRRFIVFSMPADWLPKQPPQIFYTSGHADALGPKNNDRRFWPVTA